MSNSVDKIIPLGQLIKPHGIKGELKILFFNEDSKALKSNQVVHLRALDDEVFKYKIERISYSLKKK